MNHSDHLRIVVECIAQDVAIPMCPECHDIADSFTVAGAPIKKDAIDESDPQDQE